MRALFSVSIMLLCACDATSQKDVDSDDPTVDVVAHLSQFVTEAKLRGFDYASQVEAIEVSFQERIVVDGTEFCGFVELTEAGFYSNRVLLAGNEACWHDEATEDREALVFHELGHAILDRPHKDDRLPNLAWASLMATKNNGSFYSGNISNRRLYYVDELFDENTPEPDWSN